jgi:hypothetical protein
MRSGPERGRTAVCARLRDGVRGNIRLGFCTAGKGHIYRIPVTTASAGPPGPKGPTGVNGAAGPPGGADGVESTVTRRSSGTRRPRVPTRR